MEEVNFHDDKVLYIFINILSIFTFPMYYIMLFYFTNIFLVNKPNDILYYFILFSKLSNGYLILFLGILIFMMSVHELIHGLFFYLFTGEKPVFGFKNLSAYAGVPNYFIRKNYYLIACLSPLVVLSLLGIILFFSTSGVLATIMFITTSAHAAGCIGDIWVSIKLFKKPKDTFINDDGLVIKIGHNS